MRGMPRDAYVEAKVGLGGPVLGSLAAWAVLWAGHVAGSPMLVNIATPASGQPVQPRAVAPLDGGRIAGAFSRRVWLWGYAAGVVALVLTRSPLLLVVLVAACSHCGAAGTTPCPATTTSRPGAAWPSAWRTPRWCWRWRSRCPSAWPSPGPEVVGLRHAAAGVECRTGVTRCTDSDGSPWPRPRPSVCRDRHRLAQRGAMTPEMAERRWAAEKELASLAVIERKVMLPMRDGVRLATDIYRPKGGARVPAIFVRTPYNFNFWTCATACGGHERGAHRRQARLRLHRPERARPFFSKGTTTSSGRPRTGTTRSRGRPRSRGPTGRWARPGVSSTAEYQMGVAALGHPAYAAMNVQGFGAGVGRVRPYFEQGTGTARRRRADAVHHVALRRAEPGAPDVPARHAAGRPDPPRSRSTSRSSSRAWTGRRRCGTCRRRTS